VPRSGSTDPGGTEPMFDIPQPYRAPKRKADPMVSRWAKFKGRFTCDLCIMNIHDGISDTQLSQAKHSLTRGERRWLLCSVHAAQVRNGERKLDG
jgi:hypothetical protein